jgi:hypothetical protein
MILLSFNQQAQQLLEYLRFDGGPPVQYFPVGRGHLFWASYPIELAETSRASAVLYQQVLERVNIPPSIDSSFLFGDNLLINPIDLRGAVLYVLENESVTNARISLRDTATGVELKLDLPSERAALALIDKKTKQIVAKYGF